MATDNTSSAQGAQCSSSNADDSAGELDATGQRILASIDHITATLADKYPAMLEQSWRQAARTDAQLGTQRAVLHQLAAISAQLDVITGLLMALATKQQ